MLTQAQIKATQPSDFRVLAQIAEAVGLFPAELLPEFAEGYLTGRTNDIWLTAVEGDDPIGFAYCAPERLTTGTWNLLAIGVMPSAQGHGTGAMLLRHLEGALREGGHRLLLVETLGTAEFARTRAFYRANGFTEEARIRDFYEAGGDKVVFSKHLAAGGVPRT